MNTILVPTDFSETAKNAALYAIGFAKKMHIPNIALYHSYQVLSITNPLDGYEQKVSAEPFKEKSMQQLEAFLADLGNIPEGVHVELFHGGADLKDGIAQVVEITDADLIIMGITGGGKIKETLIGSNTLTVAKNTEVPVVIVPANTNLSTFDKVALITDFKDLEANIPQEKIKQLLASKTFEFSIVHVSENKTASNFVKEIDVLKNMFADFQPTFHFENASDFTDGVSDFAEKNHIDLIIIVPKQHGVLESMFKSHTKTLAFHTKTPLFVAHN
ncbi:MAG: universal stress protein [Chitinophagaceae bacterium]